jgi:hypothetical protein
MTGPIRQLRTYLRRWLRGPDCVHLDRDPQDITNDRVRRDVEAAMADMQLLTRPQEECALLAERIRLLGLERAYIETAASSLFLDLQRKCRTCDSQRRCARDLARGDAAVGMERYCENAEALDALLVQRFGR